MARLAEMGSPGFAAFVRRFDLVRLVRYGLASVAALAVDMAAFLVLLAADIPVMPATATAYSIGIVTHWLISSRAVFTDTVAKGRSLRRRQKALFIVSALIGLLVTTCIVGAGATAGFDPRLAKLVAIGASFAVTWILRSKVVFRHNH